MTVARLCLNGRPLAVVLKTDWEEPVWEPRGILQEMIAMIEAEMLAAEPVGFANGLDAGGERRKDHHRSQGGGLEQLNKGTSALGDSGWCRRAAMGGRSEFGLRCLRHTHLSL